LAIAALISSIERSKVSLTNSTVRLRAWELELTAKDGSVKTVAWSNMSGRFPITGWASWAIGVDVTGRKRAEEHAAQAERLAAMERMAGALAHEINNPLQAIESSLGLVLDSPLGEEERWSYLQYVRVEVERLKALTSHVLDFTRPLRLKCQSTAVAEIVHRTLGLVGGRLRDSDIQVHVDVPDDLPRVFASADHMVHVLLNLVLNAVDAMPEGGRLNVAARGCGERVELTVADTGRGISPDVLPSLFDPFCTTKEGGTGMGLAVSRSIVQQYGGTITADNAPGGGAVFTIVLPQASADAPRPCDLE
jgi:signal transduction histidine kinase